LGQRVVIDAIYFPDGLVLENLSSFGFVQNSNYAIENISSSNPASLINFDSALVGISYQYVSTQNPGGQGDIMHNRAYPLLPQSLGAVYPINNFRIGIGISQRYNSLLDFGEIRITSVENPYGIGQSYTPKFETLIIGFSNLYSYSLPSLFYKDDVLSLGFQFNLDRMDYNSKFIQTEGTSGGFSTSYSFGLHYKSDKSLHPGLFEIGFFYEKGSLFKKEMKFNYKSSLQLYKLNSDSSHPLFPVLDSPTWSVIAKTPDKLNYGFIYSPESRLHFSLNSRTVYWNKGNENWKNCSEFSCSVLFDYSPTTRFSFGLFSSIPRVEDNNYNSQEINEKQKVVYATIGLHLETNNFIYDISLADSHIYSGLWRRHTILKSAVAIKL
jgi:hypothetical protein